MGVFVGFRVDVAVGGTVAVGVPTWMLTLNTSPNAYPFALYIFQ